MVIARVFYALLALLISVSPSVPVVRCQSDDDTAVLEVIEGADLCVIRDDTHVLEVTNIVPAPDISTVCLFPKNPGKVATADEVTELLVGLYNEGDSVVKVTKVHATLHLPFDHRMYSQNLTLRARYYDLVGSIIYEIDQKLYQIVFYNGTIEVIGSEGFINTESVFLFTLGVALVSILGMWLYRQMQHYSKKTKRKPKVEVGTQQTAASTYDWLEGTAYVQTIGKEKKKK